MEEMQVEGQQSHGGLYTTTEVQSLQEDELVGIGVTVEKEKADEMLKMKRISE